MPAEQSLRKRGCAYCGGKLTNGTKYCSQQCRVAQAKRRKDLAGRPEVPRKRGLTFPQIVRKLAKKGWGREELGDALNVDEELLTAAFNQRTFVSHELMEYAYCLLEAPPPSLIDDYH